MFSFEFLMTSLVVVLVPGTGVIYTVSTGLAQRRRASIAAAAGCTAGIIPHLTASILGLSAILHMSAQAFQVIKIVGALYMLYLAWMMWKESGALQLERAGQPANILQIAVKGLLINILNPKLTLFFFAFLPLFVLPEQGSVTQQMLGLSSIFMTMTFVIFALYGLLASAVSVRLLQSPPAVRRVQRAFSLIFAALAVRLALTEQ